MSFSLFYHASIPGRGEFIRLFLEATGTAYTDVARAEGQSCVGRCLKGDFPGAGVNPVPFAPPVLQHGDVLLFQTAAILSYLDRQLPAIDGRSTVGTTESTFHHRLSLALTVLDFNDEAHNTHHPINSAQYYEEQKEEAAKYSESFREARVPKFFGYFESVLAKSGSSYLLPEGITYPDLALFQVVDGVTFAFPNLITRLKPEYPHIFSLYDRVKSLPRISSYLASDRRLIYSHGVFRHYPELDPAA